MAKIGEEIFVVEYIRRRSNYELREFFARYEDALHCARCIVRQNHLRQIGHGDGPRPWRVWGNHNDDTDFCTLTPKALE